MNRAGALMSRYERHGQGDDLEAAIRGYDAALADSHLPATDRPTCQMNRASALLTRYERHGREADLDAAITGYTAALADPHLPAAEPPHLPDGPSQRPAEPLPAPRAGRRP